MNCLNCGNQMQKGFLRSDTIISWVPDSLTTSSLSRSNQSDTFQLNLSSNQLYAYRCLGCKQIVLALEPKPNIPHKMCPKCGNSVQQTETFCNKCGEEIQSSSEDAQFLCLNCKNPIKSDDIVCPTCGSDLDQFANDILNTCVECGYSDPSLEDLAECPKCGALLPI